MAHATWGQLQSLRGKRILIDIESTFFFYVAYHFPELRQQAQLVAPSSPPPFPLPPPFSPTPFDFSCNKQSSPWGVHWTMRPMRTDKPKRSEVKLGALGGCFGGWSWVHLQLINWHMDIFMQPLKFCAQIFYTHRA